MEKDLIFQAEIQGLHLWIMSDNSVAVAYVNKQGAPGVPGFNRLPQKFLLGPREP